MPYIKQQDRKRWDFFVNGLQSEVIEKGISTADLAYLLCKVMNIYLDRHGGVETSWVVKADVVKAVDSALDSYKAEILLPHEERKRKENGPVFG